MNQDLHGNSRYYFTDPHRDTNYEVNDVETIGLFLSALIRALDPASQCTLHRSLQSAGVISNMEIRIEPFYWGTYDEDRNAEKAIKCL